MAITLRVKCEPFNILEANEALIARAREIGITTLPVWKYRRKRNVVFLVLKVNMPNSTPRTFGRY
ncbi:MAG: hypothetical protein IKE76_12440 [Clostridia bacterium]|nr:hypothetical protein [Clostridia bacterium]